MKRLLPFFFLLILVVTITGMLAQPPQDASLRVVDPLILTAVNDTAFVLVDGTVDVDVLANDIETNAGCTKILLTILTGPFNSNISFPDSTHIERGDPLEAMDDYLVYVPDAGYIGRDSLQYEVGRGGPGCGSTIDSAWVHVYVNRAPTAVNDTLQVVPDSTNRLDVLANDSDIDGDALTIDSLGALPVNGMAAIVAGVPGKRLATTEEAQVIAYTPDAGYIGPDSLQYYTSDDKLGIDSAWVFLTVNAPPVAVADSTTTLPDTAVDIDVLANDSDPEGGALTLVGTLDGPANGTADVNGVVTYTPDAGYVGPDTFRYVVVDSLGGTDTTTVFVSVNTPPMAEDDAVGTPFGVPSDFDVLANDTDADGDALTVEAIVEAPDDGTAALIDGGLRVRYTPDAGFFGTDTFTYRAADGRGGTDEATVTVTVSANAAVQFIHNALPAGPVDVYVDDTRVLDDFDYRTATPYVDIPAGDQRVDVTEGGAADNSAPFFSTMLTLVPLEAYVAIANGVAGQNFAILLQEDARPVADDTTAAEFFIVHGVLDAPASGIDVHLLDPDDNNLPVQVLSDDLNYEESTPYRSLPPAVYNLDATSFNGAVQYDAYQFDLSGLKGQTLTLVLSGLFSPGAGEPGFTLLGFDAQGTTHEPAIVTALEAAAEVPQEFSLRGNYPNPFNPTTTISFDLPESAEVTVEVVDMLGRVVLVVPAQAVEAGAGRTLAVDAGSLASGTYLYRLIAAMERARHVATGRMVLVK